VIWQASIVPDTTGDLQIAARVTDQYGQVQPHGDPDSYDGQNSSPSITVVVR